MIVSQLIQAEGAPLRRRTLAPQPRPLHGRRLLAVERLLAGRLVGCDRLLPSLEGSPLPQQEVLSTGFDLNRRRTTRR
ncbi:MAG: hypothetical protein MZU97_19975 [Bacillus subtilis]|nr:hypothetical protein [Bacillus subtilis]